MSQRFVLAIDAGTTGIRVFLIDHKGRIARSVYSEFTQHYPKPGWVEHDAAEIWQTTERLLGEVLAEGDAEIVGIGITNQRETTVVWDAESHQPLARAIVWQDRRTSALCKELTEAGHTKLFHQRTGLTLDAYFSGTKLRWLYDHEPAVKEAVAAGRARFGTVDSWILWNLTGGAVHATDYTNASRTLMFNIVERRWDDELLKILGIPRAEGLLPEVKSSSHIYGHTVEGLVGEGSVPVAGIAGDQQAALFGQGCVEPGELKNTYGTGCFALVNSGRKPRFSSGGLLTTIACDAEGKPVYALEGSVFIAGAVVQWLRDGLEIIESAEETEALAESVEDTHGCYLVPAFAGLGAPHWDMDARGAVLGLTRGVDKAHLTRAALESIAYQTRDLVEVFETDLGQNIEGLNVDGGAVANDFLMQFQADILDRPVIRPAQTETTVLGAAYLAGLATGFWENWEEISKFRRIDRTFQPKMETAKRKKLYHGWQEAVKRVLSE